jgi:phage baseplate assembly protein W
MSFSLRLVNGDLDLSSNTMGVVRGVEKLTQDLSLWLREQYGIDRFHPDYGSALDSFIGQSINIATQHEIQVEVLRVLSLYQQIQTISLQKNPNKFTLDEILYSVTSVDCQAGYDNVYVTVRFVTALGTPGQVSGRITV